MHIGRLGFAAVPEAGSRALVFYHVSCQVITICLASSAFHVGGREEKNYSYIKENYCSFKKDQSTMTSFLQEL